MSTHDCAILTEKEQWLNIDSRTTRTERSRLLNWAVQKTEKHVILLLVVRRKKNDRGATRIDQVGFFLNVTWSNDDRFGSNYWEPHNDFPS